MAPPKGSSRKKKMQHLNVHKAYRTIRFLNNKTRSKETTMMEGNVASFPSRLQPPLISVRESLNRYCDVGTSGAFLMQLSNCRPSKKARAPLLVTENVSILA